MNCPALLGAGGQVGLANILRGLDCMTQTASAQAFARLLGGEGVLTTALTALLTIYVAVLALGLILGRSGLSVSALPARMIVLGLALTFATSWLAYSQAIWNLLAAGPDWLAAQLLGLRGSATLALANRLDGLFAALLEAAHTAQTAQGDAKGVQPSDLLDLAALGLMVGSVGVLVTSRIVLAVLLALGPLFIVMALFEGTRGLFEGWLKATVAFALVPLFAVLLGAGVSGVILSMLRSMAGSAISMEQAAAVLMAALVHAALMIMAMRVTALLTSGWRIGHGPGQAGHGASGGPGVSGATRGVASSGVVALDAGSRSTGAENTPPADRRLHAILSAVSSHSSPAPSRVYGPPSYAASGPASAPVSPTRSRQLARQITSRKASS